MNYTPDNWVVLKIESESKGLIYKVLAGWSGGYLQGDSWRLNSGISRVEYDHTLVLFHGASGSVYECHKDTYRLTMATSGIYERLKSIEDVSVEIMPEDTNWLEMIQ